MTVTNSKAFGCIGRCTLLNIVSTSLFLAERKFPFIVIIVECLMYVQLSVDSVQKKKKKQKNKSIKNFYTAAHELFAKIYQ